MKKIIITIAAVLLLASCTAVAVQAPAALPEQVQTPITSMRLPLSPPFADYIGGGDCSADRATGDLYLEPDPYCLTAKGETIAAKIAKVVKHATQAVVTALTPTNTPTLAPTATSTPVPTITGTPSPTQKPTGTPEPTNTPNVTKTPEPTQEPTEEAKTDNGNHYGNDKPDNNSGDNSKFNGDNSREDFEKTKNENKKN